MSDLTEVKLPNIGDFAEVEIIEVHVKEGDSVSEEQPLITLETDKAAMEVPSPYSGVISKMNVKLGDKVKEGSVILQIQTSGQTDAGVKTDNVDENNADNNVEIEEKNTEKNIKKNDIKADKESNEEDIKPVNRVAGQEFELNASNASSAGPATRRLAREFNVNLDSVVGTGRSGRVTTQDLARYIKSNVNTGGGLDIEPAPDIDFRKFGEVQTVSLNRIKKLSAKHLSRNWVTIPHVTQFDEADVTEMEKFRQENKAQVEAKGAKLTPLVFIMKACVAALKDFPNFNASLSPDKNELILKKYYHFGIAVDTEEGLVVPVIKDVDKKSITELALELAEKSEKARAGKLKAEDIQGSCFSISSLGGIGGVGFTPIINAPDVAILGVSKATIKPVFVDNDFVPRLMLPLSLSYDHRVIDGAEAARFTRYLADKMADIRRLLL